MFRKVSLPSVLALISLAFMLAIAGKFLYDLGYLNATFYHDRTLVEGRIADPKGRLPFDELEAAQWSADSAHKQALLSFLSLAVSAFALFGLAISLRQTKDTIENSKTMAEIEATCYLHAAKVNWGKNNRLILTCGNTGNTPATHFSIGCHAYVETRGQVVANLNFEPAKLKTWSALAGHDQYTVSLDKIDFHEIDIFLQHANDPMFVFVVSGNIYYKNVFGKTFKTQFAFYTSSAELDAKFARPTARLEVHSPLLEMPLETG